MFIVFNISKQSMIIDSDLVRC